MTVTVRFAPSPTGRIHIGNTRTALFNWLYARKHGGRFILRFDDTDLERSRKDYADGIARDLDWLGILPDQTVAQSERFGSYDAAAARLKAAGLLYPCYETPEELERRRKIRLSRRLPPVYGREALKLTEEEKAGLEAEGRMPHWRFLLPNFADDPFATRRTEVHWDDVVRGPQTVDLASMSDPVLIRADGTYLYTLPSVVDDIDLGITHVIRGDDHVTNTGAQIALFRALGAEPPAFGHHNLLTTVSGEGLSKRTGALSIASLRESGIEPMAVASLAVLIGTSENVVAAATMEELADRFEPTATSRSAAKFDPAELSGLSRQLIQHMPYDEAARRLAALGIDGAKAEAFWNAVRGNLERLDDASIWWRIVNDKPDGEAGLSDEDRVFVREAMQHLPQEPWDGGTWRAWTDAVKAATGRKGRALFMPLRVALTGREAGPELAGLLPLLGREETLARRP
ncbi:glutamate--tRNA ligase [Nitratireductor sp. ZSWI3]|uniref:glutamate--tRNA ligase n=1 Tax=Nitratireductor sp. ZSWI3 TaxID=2966359 RepID=UPI002150199F|nr:glutamate--tRNA ligase [Nitratireductor sp. ZSWI3]MCR4266668.1 glutamate--tRNA ligase [Nitratireductor sp. ZSWI3]